MARPGLEGGELQIWPAASGAQGVCLLHAQLPPWFDPTQELGQLGWTKPVVVAETGARSCDTWAWLQPSSGDLLVGIPGNETAQAAWVSDLTGAGWLFVAGAFLGDYPPLGPWIPAQSSPILDPATYQVFNAFPCMGLYDSSGQAKPGPLAAWHTALGK